MMIDKCGLESQPSLRDATSCRAGPGIKMPGYFQMFLRNKTARGGRSFLEFHPIRIYFRLRFRRNKATQPGARTKIIAVVHFPSGVAFSKANCSASAIIGFIFFGAPIGDPRPGSKTKRRHFCEGTRAGRVVAGQRTHAPQKTFAIFAVFVRDHPVPG
jgi:hypothetical protein